jgi:hypothetical protein
MLTQRRVLNEIIMLDWSGHVELPVTDMQWLAAQLFARLSSDNSEVCAACEKVGPLVIQTAVGYICAECVEDMNDQIDQTRELLGE